MERVTLPRVSRQSQMSLSRATVRSVEDNHLIQEVKEADVYHSETASNRGAPLERWQMVGVTSVPLKQEEDQQQQSSQQLQGEEDGFNHNQPKGKAAEAMMLYLNGTRSHPVAIVDDRRVRPYNMKEGEGAFYHAAGSEQMYFMNDAGAYLVSLDGKSVKNKNGNETRMASLRHVTKDMQTHEIREGEQQQEYKHEGKTVNTEVRCIKDRIEFRAGTKVVGYYEVSSDTWYFTGKLIHNEATEELRDNAPTHNRTGNTIKDSAGTIKHNE